MKKFYFLVTYHLLLALLFCSFFAPIPSDLSMKIPVFANPALCRASTIGTILPGTNETVEKASCLAVDTLYKDTISTGATHYYCLIGPANTGYVCITLTANEIPSLSFQLFDSTGTAHSLSSYQYEPSTRTLQIKYFFSANESYLLAISNLLSQSITYTICYTDPKMNRNQDKENTSKPKKTPKPKVSIKPKKTPKPKITIKPKETPKPKTSIKPKKAPKPKTSIRPNKSQEPKRISKPEKFPKSKITPKPNAPQKTKKTSKPKTTIRKLTLSKTFLRIPAGAPFSLKANIRPKNSNPICQWIVSDPSILKQKRSRNISTGSILTAKGRKKGTVIITCKTNGKRQLSASCTVKIV